MLSFLVIFVVSRVGIGILHITLDKVIPDRKIDNHLSQPGFAFMDYLYMTINQLNETIFIRKLLDYVTILPYMKISVSGVVHAFLSSYLILKIDDALYWVFHRTLHKNRKLYKFIHLHHHNNEAPCRGYIDAINEHPIEMITALLINICAINLVFHILVKESLFVFLVLKACFAIINHMDRDFKIPFVYDSEQHILHHSKKVIYFGQM